MEYIKGTPRGQLYLFNECFDNLVEVNNPVRIINAYVESLDYKFKCTNCRAAHYKIYIFI